MKKTILAVAFVAIAMVSCDPKKNNTGDPVETPGTEIEQKIDTATQKTEEAVDTTKAKTGEVQEKTEDAEKEVKETAKK